jgi:hypothetical protein
VFIPSRTGDNPAQDQENAAEKLWSGERDALEEARQVVSNSDAVLRLLHIKRHKCKPAPDADRSSLDEPEHSRTQREHIRRESTFLLPLELCHGTLANCSYGRSDEVTDSDRQELKSLLQAVHELHAANRLHRDLDANNILFRNEEKSSGIYVRYVRQVHRPPCA